MIERNITPGQRSRAKIRYNFDSSEWDSSVTKGEGDDPGAVGEIFVLDLFTPNHDVEDVANNCRDWDFVINEINVEVKTTRSKYNAHSGFHAQLFESSFHQKPDFYFFVAVNYEMTIAQLGGYISRDRFFRESRKYHKGQTGDNGFFYPETCRVMKFGDLNQFDESKFIDFLPGNQMQLFE